MKALFLVLMLCVFGAVSKAGDSSIGTLQNLPVAAKSSPEPIAAVSVPAGTSLPAVAVAETAAPPAWAQNLIVAAEKLPFIGPVVAKILLYAGILSSVLTALVACLLGILNTLMGAANLAGLSNLANALAAFRDGKFMYWLKYLSMFNAKPKVNA